LAGLSRQPFSESELQYAQRSFQPVTLSSTGTKSKPVLDEGGFQQLLAAAYVLQHHNDSLHAKDPRLDAAWIFSQVSEIENLVRQGGLSHVDAAKLVGERLCSMTGAVSAGVYLLQDGRADCLGESGVGAQAVGQSLAADSEAAQERLKNGRQFQSLDAQSDSRLDSAICRELGVRSLLAVPILQSDQTTGLIEVRWGLADAIHECDVRTCRLMANVLAEVLGRDGSKSVTDFMLPPSQGRVKHENQNPPADVSHNEMAPDIPETKQSEPSSDLAAHCRVCGRPFSSDETFCGHCSMPRVAASTNADGLQSKWASMWFMQQAQGARTGRRASKFWPVEPQVPKTPTTSGAKAADLPLQKPGAPPARWSPALSAPSENPTALFPAEAEPLTPSRPGNSAQTDSYSVSEQGLRILEDESEIDSGARLSSSLLSRLRPILSVRIKISRRTVALAVCSTVAVLFLAGWLSWPTQSPTHLSWFESLMVDLGLAEVQARRPPPVYAGDPNVRVWEDVHTALYYCPDSDLYGKTPGGRFSSQRAAQEDQFEPATRLACQ
jgi:hypothetical protein